MKLEIFKVVKWSDTHWTPCGLSLYDKRWWRIHARHCYQCKVA